MDRSQRAVTGGGIHREAAVYPFAGARPKADRAGAD